MAKKKKRKSLTKDFWLKLLFAILILALVNYIIVLSINAIKKGQLIGVEEEENIITVQGKGEVYVKPDLAVINFSVKDEAKTVEEAMEANINKMNSVIVSLKEQGFLEKDIRTASFDLRPRYEYKEDGERIMAGYEVSQLLEVKIRNLSKIGEIIQTATVAGANQIGNLSLDIENKEDYKKEAREKAILQAKTKAKELAEQLEVNLAGIKSFSENSGYFDTAKVEFDSVSTANIETGENKIEVNVTVVYKINN